MSGSQRDVTFRFLAEPTDVNFGGKVHGGAVMKWIDQAGYACAAGWAGRYCVTVYVGGIQFERPIQVGQIVEVHAQIVHTGSTSMHVAVDVAARDATADGAERTTVAVPAYTPQNDEERELSSYAQRMMLMRRQVEAERRSFLARFRSATTSPQQ